MSFLIFLVFLCVQGVFLLPLIGSRGAPTSPHPLRPASFIVDERIQPPRKLVMAKTEGKENGKTPLIERHLLANGGIKIIPSVPPAVAFVLGRKMDWNRITTDDLIRLPGIRSSMARRLIRIRDTGSMSRMEELVRYPHVGLKTVQRLKKYCFIPHES